MEKIGLKENWIDFKDLKEIRNKEDLIEHITPTIIKLSLKVGRANKNDLYRIKEYIDFLSMEWYDIRLIISDREYKNLIELNNRVCNHLLIFEFHDIKYTPIIEFEDQIDNIRDLYMSIISTS